MATAEQIKVLLKSHVAGDDGLFRSVALQIAAHEATKGNDSLAMELRELVDKAKRAQQPAGSPRGSHCPTDGRACRPRRRAPA